MNKQKNNNFAARIIYLGIGALCGLAIVFSADPEKFFGTQYFEPGHRMKGNFYKLCDGERAHYGSFYPADFTDINPLGSRYFGDFELVLY